MVAIQKGSLAKFKTLCRNKWNEIKVEKQIYKREKISYISSIRNGPLAKFKTLCRNKWRVINVKKQIYKRDKISCISRISSLNCTGPIMIAFKTHCLTLLLCSHLLYTSNVWVKVTEYWILTAGVYFQAFRTILFLEKSNNCFKRINLIYLKHKYVIISVCIQKITELYILLNIVSFSFAVWTIIWYM